MRFTRLAIVLVTAFLGWYFLYVFVSAFGRGLMARQVAGNINVALVFGVLQFVSTFVLAWGYARYSRRVLDPLAAQLRSETDFGLTARRLGPTRLRPELGPGPEARGRQPSGPQSSGPHPSGPHPVSPMEPRLWRGTGRWSEPGALGGPGSLGGQGGAR